MSEETYLANMANLLRLYSIRATTKAQSGHPTSCLSCAEVLATLFFKEMNIDPKNLDYLDNDEFILSKGHAAPILYAVLAEIGVLSRDQLSTLRKLNSELEGHPIPNIKGIRVATGSLGQGLSMGLGMAYAKKLRKIERRVYVLLGDGEMIEGSVWESINLAGKIGLSNLTAILDMNRLGQSGPTMFEWNSNAYLKRVEAFDWKVFVCNGHNVNDLSKAFNGARKSDKPSFVIAKTVKGKGVSFLENIESKHGVALSSGELEKAEFELLPKIKDIKSQPSNFIHASVPIGNKVSFSLKTNYGIGEQVATRESYGRALVKLGELNKRMLVLDGDVNNSTFTKSFFEIYPDQSLQCFIAEQNMVSLAVGLQSQNFDVFLATFSSFLSRAHDQLRMAAYSKANIKIAGSHAGTSIGEDGPSQMGLEDLSIFRTLPKSIVLYPCDAVSSEKLTCLTANYGGISYIRTTKAKTPTLYSNEEEFHVGGSKILRQSKSDIATIITAGITVHEALKAHRVLKEKGINTRVIDCYSIKPLDEQTLRKASVETGTLVTVEDHYPQGGLGEAVASLGLMPNILAVTKMPHSGKSNDVLAEQGLNVNGIIKKIKQTAS